MAAEVWVGVAEVLRETERAYLVQGDGAQVWLPKSQVEIWVDPRLPMPAVKMPFWLYRQHRLAFPITTTAERVYQLVGLTT